MEFSCVFYKELPVDEDNIFSANLTENNKIKQIIKLKKLKIYFINGLSIDQDLKSRVSLPNNEGRKSSSDILWVYTEEKQSFIEKDILISWFLF